MNTLVIEFDDHAIDVDFTETALHVILADGREIFVPLEWFPRLRDASTNERNSWRFIGKGVGIHWDIIDEDIAIQTLMRVS